MPAIHKLILVFIVYTVSGWIGIRFAGIGEGSISLIWLPSGIALSACIIYGKSILPAIWLASFVANTPYLIDSSAQFPIITACIYGALAATVNTLIQAKLSYQLYQRYITKQSLVNNSTIVNFVVRVALIPSMLNMALLTIIYSIGGYTEISTNNLVNDTMRIWLTGTLADFHGYFVIVPFVISWLSKKNISTNKGWNYIAISSFIIVMFLSMNLVNSAMYLLFALGVLIALNLTMRVATSFVLACSLIFTFATAQHYGPFNLSNLWLSYTSLLIFIFSLGLPIYVIIIKRYELINLYADLEEKVDERTKELNRANQQLHNISRTDGLTNIPNRRCFDDFLAAEWIRAIRNQSAISLLMIDIDHFKQFNDYYGHVEGDECLKYIAKTIQKHVNRPSDLIARYGGEEFAVVLPETTEPQSIAQHIHNEISQLNIPHNDSDVSPFVSISIGGCTMYPQVDSKPTQLIELADKALYQAKHEGRNLVHIDKQAISSIANIS